MEGRIDHSASPVKSGNFASVCGYCIGTAVHQDSLICPALICHIGNCQILKQVNVIHICHQKGPAGNLLLPFISLYLHSRHFPVCSVKHLGKLCVFRHIHVQGIKLLLKLRLYLFSQIPSVRRLIASGYAGALGLCHA